MTDLRRVAYCGRVLHGAADFVTVVKSADGVASFGGLQTCQSVWACPVCSAAIRQGRSVEVEQAATAHIAAGGSLAFVTFTLPHDLVDDLAPMLDDLNAAWKTVQQSRGYRGRREDLGLAAVRAVEITDGANGWHPHLHLLLFLDRVVGKDALNDLAGYLAAAWADAIEKRGRRRPNEHGTRVQGVSMQAGASALAQYLSKVQDGYGSAWSLGSEMARGDLKSGRRPGVRTPFDLAVEAAAGDARSLARWREYEQATHGRRCMTWTVGLRDRYAVPEVPDADLVAPAGEAVAFLSRQDHELVCRYRREAAVLDLAETATGGAIYALVRALWRRDEYDQRRRAARELRDVRT